MDVSTGSCPSGQEDAAPLDPQALKSAQLYPLDPARLGRAKAAWTARHLEPAAARFLLRGRGIVPRAGDYVLARICELGHHGKLELTSGRRARLYEGDEVLLVYANRYASDQFEAAVPGDLGPCELVAAGGIAGRCLSRHSRSRPPTTLAPVGLLASEDGVPLSTRNFAPLRGTTGAASPPGRPPTFAVLGSAMNAGKTTVAAALVRGWSRLGLRVAAIKATGTGSSGDRFACLDAGAALAIDFGDFGYPSTHRLPPARLLDLFERALAHAAAAGAERIVVEIADGVLFEETRRLVAEARFRRHVDGVLFAAVDALGAVAGLDRLRGAGLPVLAVSGMVTTSPLAMREFAAVIDLPIVRPGHIGRALWLPEGCRPLPVATGARALVA